MKLGVLESEVVAPTKMAFPDMVRVLKPGLDLSPAALLVMCCAVRRGLRLTSEIASTSKLVFLGVRCCCCFNWTKLVFLAAS